MTTAIATTPAQSTAAVRATSPFVRLVVVTVLALMLTVGAFAVGRTTASESSEHPTMRHSQRFPRLGARFLRRPHPLLRGAEMSQFSDRHRVPVTGAG